MSKPRIRSVDVVPRTRPQRSVQPSIDEAWPKDATGYHTDKPGIYLPGQLGRFPTVGLDEGAMKHTRPDRLDFRE